MPRQNTRRQRTLAVSREPRQLVLRVTLREITPSVWRSVRVPDAFTLHQLHRVLQIVFSRLDYHLYAFDFGDRHFEAPDPEAEEPSEDSTTATLAGLGLRKDSRFEYVYDFGDNWVHDVVVEQQLPMPAESSPDWSPRLIDGQRASPPEDAGGPFAYAELVAALRDRSHPEHKQMRDWVGPHFDPERFDPWSIDHALTLAVAWGAI